jgi:hypothetical protein
VAAQPEAPHLEAVVRSRHAVWVGLLFVLSAGLAREYDGKDLLHEPWHAFLPLAASLVSSGLLFLLAYSIARWKGIARPAGFFTQYRAFLALFWMTAPLAWLYALPHERLFDPVPAVVLNLVTLGVVSAWRVALMIWVLRAYFGYPLVSAAFLVLLFADVVVLGLMQFVPFPLIEVMGGIHVSQREQILQSVTQTGFLLDFCSLPLWLMGGFCWVLRWPMDPRPWARDEGSPGRPSRGLWILAGVSVGVELLLLPFTQPEQIRRWRVERAFGEGHYEEGFAILSAHEQDDFPPGWDLPPKVVGWNPDPLLYCVEYAVDHDVAPWVREAYLRKFEHVVLRSKPLIGVAGTGRVARLLFRIPEGPGILQRLEDDVGDSYPVSYLKEEIEKLRSQSPTPEPKE